MDKRRRDSNSPSSKSGRQKGARETSPAVAAPVEKGRQHVRPIRTETSSDVFQALKSSCKWLHFLGPDIPPGNEHDLLRLSQLSELIVILSLMKSKPSSSSSLSKQGQQSTPLPLGRNKLHYSRCSVGLSPCFGIGTNNQETLVATRSAQRTGWRTDTPALAATRPVMIGNKQPPSCAKTKTNAKAVD